MNRLFLTASTSLWIGLTVAGATMGAPAATGPASAPASQPADQIVLVRLGDRDTITQAEFEKLVRYDPAKGYSMRNTLMMACVQDHLLALYAADHPDWITQQEVDARLAVEAKGFGLESVEAARKAYESRGGNWADHRRFVMLNMVRSKFAQRGEEAIADENKLKEIFAARKWEFDTTFVRGRQIFFYTPVYATPDERAAIVKKLERMREDILAGKRTWEECAKESDSGLVNMDIGTFPRHMVQPEAVGEAAFKLQAGQITPVVESPIGYYLVQVTERIAPREVSWDSLKKAMKQWINQEEYFNAMEETRRRYPMVGVQPPREPKGPPASLPAPLMRPTTHPKPQRTPVFFGDKRPAWTVHTTPSTRPASSQPTRRPTATAPAGQRHKTPTTRPAKKQR